MLEEPNGSVRRLSGAVIPEGASVAGSRARVEVDGQVLLVTHHDAHNSTLVLRDAHGALVAQVGLLPRIRPYVVDAQGRSMHAAIDDMELNTLNFRIGSMLETDLRLDVEEAREIIGSIQQIMHRTTSRER